MINLTILETRHFISNWKPLNVVLWIINHRGKVYISHILPRWRLNFSNQSLVCDKYNMTYLIAYLYPHVNDTFITIFEELDKILF